MPGDGVLMPKGPDPVALLLGRVPEFRPYLEPEYAGLPYVVFEFFAQYLRGLSAGDPVLDRAFAFVNELAESRDEELRNLLQVSVFEQFAGDAESAPMVKARLREEALKLFVAAEEMLGKI